jgi:hypothetical protein
MVEYLRAPGVPDGFQRYPSKSYVGSVATSTPLTTAMIIYEGEGLGVIVTNSGSTTLQYDINLYITDSTLCNAWAVQSTTMVATTFRVLYYTPTTTPPFQRAEILVGSTIAVAYRLDVVKSIHWRT